ncbi:hypothetical protein ACVRW7_00035 [Streptococcus ratti]|uniref:hypothetical protein n=1 Tax=Streptococcus ratti TaxID=1341 RepID=UPI00138AFFCD|nr:hypothetical protein [Streptococcus ratti]
MMLKRTLIDEVGLLVQPLFHVSRIESHFSLSEEVINGKKSLPKFEFHWQKDGDIVVSE